MLSTVDSWARLIPSLDQIPEAFKEKFNIIVNNADFFPYTVFVPPDRWGKKRSNPKIISVFNNAVYVLEKLKKEIKLICFDFQDICRLERSKSLLHSWIIIESKVDHKMISVLVEFNTVVEGIFNPIIVQIRKAVSGYDDETSDAGFDLEQSKFDYLNNINYKLMNFGKQSILPGEKVARIIYQSQIKVLIFKLFWKYITPSHIVILTDKEFIVITENVRHKGDLTYGGVWSYIPLYQVTGLSMTSNEKDGFMEGIVHLLNQEQFLLRYSLTQQIALSSLKSDIRDLRQAAGF
jgi:hypothetical protein